MKTRHILLSLALVAIAGCSSSSLTDTGSYRLDTDHFSSMLADKLIEAGKAPPAARDQVVRQLKDAAFDLDLKPDGTFVCQQRIMSDRRTYRGTWSLTGATFTLDQTHENEQEVADHMSGTLIAGELKLTHKSDEGTLDLVLHHQAPATPR